MKPFTGFEPPRLFIDTWGWLSLEDRNDPAHGEVLNIRRSALPGFWITTDYVLDETVTRLFSRRPFPEAAEFCAELFRAAESGWLQVEPVTPERFRAAYQLRLRYRDKPRISFTDLTSFVVMRELGIRHVLTADAHFEQAHLGFRKLP